jgi:prepilin peptidase CpaA
VGQEHQDKPVMHVAITILLGALLATAAWYDLLTRSIPDRFALLLAGLGLMIQLGAGWLPLLHAVLTAAVVFAVLLGCAMLGWLGGGDVKLAAALTLSLPPLATLDFLGNTVLAGGVLGLCYLAGPRLLRQPGPQAPRQPGRLLRIEVRRLRRGGPVPYGVAIACGGILTLIAQI